MQTYRNTIIHETEVRVLVLALTQQFPHAAAPMGKQKKNTVLGSSLVRNLWNSINVKVVCSIVIGQIKVKAL